MTYLVSVTLPGGSPAPDSLRQFFSSDPGFRAHGKARWQPAGPVAEGQLGTGPDVLTLVVTGVLALPSAVETVRRWCTTPGQRHTAVELRTGETVITVTAAATSQEVGALAAALATALTAAPPPPPAQDDDSVGTDPNQGRDNGDTGPGGARADAS